MYCEEVEIQTGRIPAAVWGVPTGRCIVAAHGSMSHKKDVPIVLLAQAAQAHGWQVLSFDLPQHGARAQNGWPCTMRNCAANLETVMQYARLQWPHLALFGCSMGAYAGLLACRKEALEAAFFFPRAGYGAYGRGHDGTVPHSAGGAAQPEKAAFA